MKKIKVIFMAVVTFEVLRTKARKMLEKVFGKKEKRNIAQKIGFTLAEMLIVIIIIGVVAAIVTPMIFGTTSDAQFHAAWKKKYADLSQVTQMLVVDNGGSLAGAFPGNVAGGEALKDAFASKLNIIKDCSGASWSGGTGIGASAEGCWHEGANSWYYLNGTAVSGSNWTYPGLILNNGSLMYFHVNSSNCSQTAGDYKRCGHIYIDVNGFKKPNIIGKDVFGVNITSNALIPWGARGLADPSTTCIEGSTAADNTNTGYGCSAKYLYE